jgi:hypothetical protein
MPPAPIPIPPADWSWPLEFWFFFFFFDFDVFLSDDGLESLLFASPLPKPRESAPGGPETCAVTSFASESVTAKPVIAPSPHTLNFAKSMSCSPNQEVVAELPRTRFAIAHASYSLFIENVTRNDLELQSDSAFSSIFDNFPCGPQSVRLKMRRHQNGFRGKPSAERILT